LSLQFFLHSFSSLLYYLYLYLLNNFLHPPFLTISL
jgi:hypothetical protein